MSHYVAQLKIAAALDSIRHALDEDRQGRRSTDLLAGAALTRAAEALEYVQANVGREDFAAAVKALQEESRLRHELSELRELLGRDFRPRPEIVEACAARVRELTAEGLL